MRETSLRSNALFFPFISLPREQWTYHTLLYWDKLTSIVPLDHIDQPSQMTSFMRTLLSSGLVEQVHPGQHLHEIEGFNSTFESLISSKLERVRSTQIRNPQHRIFNPNKKSLIHGEKLGVVQEYLVDAGVATRSHGEWYSVESWAANLFMAYLASCLGALSDVNAAPVTNRMQFGYLYQNITATPIISSRANRRQIIREATLSELMPYPSEPISVASLIKFKEQHATLLPTFRDKIESHCINLSSIENPEEREVLFRNFVQEARLEAIEIEHTMKPFWRKLDFSSISPIIGAGFSASAIPFDERVALGGGLVTLAATISQAISGIRKEKRLENAPLAYVTHVRRGFA